MEKRRRVFLPYYCPHMPSELRLRLREEYQRVLSSIASSGITKRVYWEELPYRHLENITKSIKQALFMIEHEEEKVSRELAWGKQFFNDEDCLSYAKSLAKRWQTKELCVPIATDYRVWMSVPVEKLNSILKTIGEVLKEANPENNMDIKEALKRRVSEAKANIEKLLLATEVKKISQSSLTRRV